MYKVRIIESLPNYDDYLKYQNKLREVLRFRNCTPIDWEAEAWMAKATMNTIEDKDSVMDKIMSDIAEYVKRLASARNISWDSAKGPVDVILTYRRTKNKKFSNIERNVFISQELKDKISTLNFLDKDGNAIDEHEAKDVCNLIKKFEKKFQDGEDLTNHSSKGIFSDNEDIILNNWNLRHLHLSDVEVAVDKSAMSSNRSSWLLFYIMNDDTVNFVDVVWHPKGAGFTAYRFLEIIEQNGWMKKIGFKENEDIIPGTLEPNVTKDEDIFELYKSHLNIEFEFNGKVYASFGVTSAGYGLNDIFEINRFRKKLRLILDDYKYVELEADKSDDEKIVLMFEGRDGTSSQIKFVL